MKKETLDKVLEHEFDTDHITRGEVVMIVILTVLLLGAIIGLGVMVVKAAYDGGYYDGRNSILEDYFCYEYNPYKEIYSTGKVNFWGTNEGLD